MVYGIENKLCLNGEFLIYRVSPQKSGTLDYFDIIIDITLILVTLIFENIAYFDLIR